MRRLTILSALKLQRELVEITRRSIGKWDCDVYEYIKALQGLSKMVDGDEEFEIDREIVALCKEHYGGHQQTMNAMEDLVRSAI